MNRCRGSFNAQVTADALRSPPVLRDPDPKATLRILPTMAASVTDQNAELLQGAQSARQRPDHNVEASVEVSTARFFGNKIPGRGGDGIGFEFPLRS